MLKEQPSRTKEAAEITWVLANGPFSTCQTVPITEEGLNAADP